MTGRVLVWVSVVEKKVALVFNLIIANLVRLGRAVNWSLEVLNNFY